METKAIDRAAFDVIYRENADSVYQTALRYSGNDYHAAEEITQTAFMKLYVNLGSVNEKAVNSWLLTTARRMAINYKRNLKREVLKGNILYFENESDSLENSSEDDFIKRVYDKEYRELAKNIFDDLYRMNHRWYDAILTTYFLEMPQKEVADIMGIKLEVLHSMLYRAKQWIKKNYEERFDHLKE